MSSIWTCLAKKYLFFLEYSSAEQNMGEHTMLSGQIARAIKALSSCVKQGANALLHVKYLAVYKTGEKKMLKISTLWKKKDLFEFFSLEKISFKPF